MFLFLAELGFNADVNEFFVNFQRPPVFVGRFRVVRDNADDGGESIDAHLPDVQVRDQRVTVVLNAFADHHWQIRTGRNPVQKNYCRLAHK